MRSTEYNKHDPTANSSEWNLLRSVAVTELHVHCLSNTLLCNCIDIELRGKQQSKMFALGTEGIVKA